MFDDSMTLELMAVQTTEQMAACIRNLLERGGNLSLRELEAWGIAHNRPMPRTTVGEARSGVRSPSKQLLLTLLAACKVHGDREIQAWLEALDRVQAAKSTPPRQPCFSDLQPVPASRFFVEQDDLNEISRLIQHAQDEVWLWAGPRQDHYE